MSIQKYDQTGCHLIRATDAVQQLQPAQMFSLFDLALGGCLDAPHWLPAGSHISTYRPDGGAGCGRAVQRGCEL